MGVAWGVAGLGAAQAILGTGLSALACAMRNSSNIWQETHEEEQRAAEQRAAEQLTAQPCAAAELEAPSDAGQWKLTKRLFALLKGLVTFCIVLLCCLLTLGQALLLFLLWLAKLI